MRFMCCDKQFEATSRGDYCGILNIEKGCLCLAVFERNRAFCFNSYVVQYSCIYFRELYCREGQVGQDCVSFNTLDLGERFGAVW